MTSQLHSLVGYVLHIVLAVACALLSSSTVHAADSSVIANPEIPICTSIHPAHTTKDTIRWSFVEIDTFDQLDANCPENQVVVAARNGSGPARPLAQFQVRGTCCPTLPGVLTSQHVYALEKCPEGHVVTGVRQDLGDPAKRELRANTVTKLSDAEQLQYFPYARTFWIRCTKVDASRYEVKTAKPGMFIGWYRHLRSMFEKRSSRGKIPLELRYGLGRIAQFSWAHTFCVGQPWGSILIGKGTKRCSEFLFAEVIARDVAPEHWNSSAIPSNNCLYIKAPFSATPTCMAPARPKETTSTQ